MGYSSGMLVETFEGGLGGGGWKGSVLTVGDALVLYLQVLVGPGAGVREHVGPGDHHALSAVVTPRR